EFQERARAGFFEQGRAAEHPAELLRALVAGDFARERFEPGAVAAGQDHGPFVAARVRLNGWFSSPRWLRHIYTSWKPGRLDRHLCVAFECRPPGRRCKKIRPRKKLLLENWTPARLRHDCAGVKIARLAPEMKAPALARAGRAGKIFSAGSTVAAVKCV